MLTDLMAGALADARDRQSERPLRQVEAAAVACPAALDAAAALAHGDRVKIIAEVKRASPSRGPLADIPDPAVLAQTYENAGASAISVLTEQRRFAGSLTDLSAVRRAVGIPVLRKDFIATEYQVLESRAAGADLVLLIVAALDQPTLRRLHTMVADLGMTALIETHSADEIDRAAEVGARIIGVNARDLSTFELDRNLFGSLAERIPAGTVRIAESAVSTPADVARYRSHGADAVLVGEALVTGDPSSALREFLVIA